MPPKNFTRSETQAFILVHSKTKAKASKTKAKTSKTKAKAKSAANSVPLDDNPLEDVLEGRGIGSLSLEKQTKSHPNLMEIPEADSLFPPDIFRSHPHSPRPFDAGTGPCDICFGPHFFSACAWQFRCPYDAKVGKNFKVVCHCGSKDVIDGKCTRNGCYETFGLAVHKDYKSLYTSALALRKNALRKNAMNKKLFKVDESPEGDREGADEMF